LIWVILAIVAAYGKEVRANLRTNNSTARFQQAQYEYRQRNPPAPVDLPSVQPIPVPLQYSSEVPLSEYGSAAWVHQYGNCILKEVPLPVWFIQPWVVTMQVSPAEQLIINELNKYPVEWHREVSFRDMPQTEKGSCYRYDFLLPAHRTIIEYDGIASHSTPERITADQTKTQFCRQHNINLIRLSSKHYYHMEKTIYNILQELPPKSA
jgi:hypothetical protein